MDVDGESWCGETGLQYSISYQHQRFISEARDGEPEVVWVGDNLIQNLSSSRIWDSRSVESDGQSTPHVTPAASA